MYGMLMLAVVENSDSFLNWPEAFAAVGVAFAVAWIIRGLS